MRLDVAKSCYSASRNAERGEAPYIFVNCPGNEPEYVALQRASLVGGDVAGRVCGALKPSTTGTSKKERENFIAWLLWSASHCGSRTLLLCLPCLFSSRVRWRHCARRSTSFRKSASPSSQPSGST